MPASRRTILLIATAAVLLAVFAVLTPPRLIFRRSPVVSDRVAGDVRRVAMAVEPDGSLHAALEVWTDSDWDIEYWSSITGLTPVARIVTVDLIEQRDVAIAMSGDRLALAWVDVDAKKGTYTLQLTTKRRIDRDWAEPFAIVRQSTPIADPAVALTSDGRPVVAWIEGGRLALATTPDDGAIPVRTPIPAIRGAGRPAVAAGPSGIALTYEARGVWLLDVGAGADPRLLEASGRAPAIAARDAGAVVAWAERDALVVEADGARRRIPAPLGTAPVAIAVPSAGDPSAVWKSKTALQFLSSKPAGSLAGSNECCGTVAANGSRTWFAWLRPNPGDAISRDVRLRFIGEAGRFTDGDRIPVVALPGSNAAG